MQYAEYLAKMLGNLTNEKRETSLFWWATEFMANKIHLRLGGNELKSFFNTSGIALPIVRAYGKFGRPKC
jgi:hypothetical protein